MCLYPVSYCLVVQKIIKLSKWIILLVKHLMSKTEKTCFCLIVYISIEKNIRNLGKIYKDSIASAEFSILNTGKNPLTIFDIIVDCKCTVTKFDKKPIRPGSFTKVRMTYDSKSLGFFSKKAIIKFNSAEGNYLIAIQGEVI